MKDEKTPNESWMSEARVLHSRIAALEATIATQQQREEQLQADVDRYRRLFEGAQDTMVQLSHDIRNTLTATLGSVDLLCGWTQHPRTKEEAGILGQIKHNALTILLLVTNSLDLFKIEAGRLRLAIQPVAINDVLVHVEQLYRADARRRRILLTLQLQDGLPTIEGDGAALVRVVSNLVHNALKFTPEHGRIEISSARHTGAVRITVADTGPGIPPAEAAVVREGGWCAATGKQRQGFGLGLFIAKTVVEMHGGRIAVDSTPGSGACFQLTFPVQHTNP